MVMAPERPTVATAPGVLAGRAAIYIRVSGPSQKDGASLDVQLETCQKYCASNGLDVISVFQDVESGLNVDRVQYQAALSLARAKGFDQLVVYRYDRTGRDDAEYMGMLRDFAKLGIQLASATGESPDPLYQKLAGVLAWDESRRLSIRVSGSKMKRHTEGKWNGKPVFGYRLERHPQGGTYLVPKPGEAELVTEMFSRYATGKCSLMALRTQLHEAGYAKTRYAVGYILRNRVYLGMVPHGKASRSQFKPKDDLTWAEGQHQPLVDLETFERVQKLLTDNRSRQRGGPTAKYMFSGLVRCGNCGARYQARTFKRRGTKTYVDYRCYRKHYGAGGCESSSILENRIRALVLPPIERLIAQLDQGDQRARVRTTILQQEEEAQATTQATKQGAAETLERLEARLTNLEDAYLDGEIARDRYRARRDQLAQQIEELKAQLAERPHLALPDVEQFFALVDTLEGQPPDEQEWRDIIVGVLDRVVIEGRDIRVEWQPWFTPLLEL